jgi:hypothetical protein
MRIPSLIATLALFATPLAAHQPVLTDETETFSRSAPYVVEAPETSKAIFATLTGEPHYYQISSPEEFDFYVGITAPRMEGCQLPQTFSFELLDENFNRVDGRDGTAHTWEPWYEEFGRKWYWTGPEIGETFQSDRRARAGTYYVRVSNENNTGQYVLAVGDDEKFPPAVIARTIRIMPSINREYWNEANCIPEV